MPELLTVESVGRTPPLTHIPGASEHEASVDGVRMRYWYAGSGPALLLIHGFMGYSFSWRFNVQELARNFSVYAIDLPGCGFSPRDGRLPGTLASDAEAALGLMDQLGVRQFDLLGTSRGGGVSIVLAALAAQRGMRDRIHRLILNAPINPWSSNGKLLTQLLATAIGGVCVLHVLPNFPVILRRYFKGLYADPTRIAPGSLEGYERGLKSGGTFQHLLRNVRSWHRDLALIEQSLPAITDIPTLLLWGERDSAVYLASAEDLHRRLRNSTVLAMKSIGHMPYEEAPSEFNRAVAGFLLHNHPATPLEEETAKPVR